MEKKILSNSPITYVLAQLTFPSIPNLENQVPVIHDKLRRAGYPHTVAETGQQIKVTDRGIEVSGATMHRFLSLDKTTSVTIAPDMFVFETSNYSGFDNFKKSMQDVLELIHEIVSIVGMERIGLRFINLIDPQKNSINEYIDRDLIGLEKTEESEAIIINLMESRRKTAEGQTLIIKVSKSLGGSAIPEELGNPSIKMIKSRSQDRVTAILDLDHLKVYEAQNFDVQILFGDINNLHSQIYKTFVRSVTQFALEEWS